MSGVDILHLLDSLELSFWNYLGWQQIIWFQTVLWEPMEPEDDPGGGTRLSVAAARSGLTTTDCS